jgi:hypothetical protein
LLASHQPLGVFPNPLFHNREGEEGEKAGEKERKKKGRAARAVLRRPEHRP